MLRFASVFILFSLHVSGQDCLNPYPLGFEGTWQDCWEAPQTFSNDCFDAWPWTDLCGPQCGGAYLEFEVGPTGVVTFSITSDKNYDFLPGGPELWKHFYILDGCWNPIYYTGSCGEETLGDEFWIESVNIDGNNEIIDDDYSISLLLPTGTYLMVIGNVGSNSVQDNIEGCLQVDFLNQSPLGLGIDEYQAYRQAGGMLPYKLWAITSRHTLLGQKR